MSKEILSVLQWVIYAVYVLGINVGWIYGSRKGALSSEGITYATLATTMLMTVVSIIFIMTDINKFHLIWITPTLIFTSSFNIKIFLLPIIGNLYFSFVKSFGLIICFPKNKQRNKPFGAVQYY